MCRWRISDASGAKLEFDPGPRQLLDRAQWGTCPGCAQAAGGEYHGRVLRRGATVAAQLDAIRRRIRNVARRAEFTQPERRIVSIEWDGNTLEILTTSQMLAHRIAHELAKAFGDMARDENDNQQVRQSALRVL